MREESKMLVVPSCEDDIRIEKIMERLSASSTVRLSKTEKVSRHGADAMKISVDVNKRIYDIFLAVTDVIMPDYFRTEHFFSDIDFKKIDGISYALAVEMDYNDEFLVTYHDQLKIIDCFVPEKLAVIDIPSEKILSGKWVKLAAQSEVPPSPKYLFTVQGISGEGDEVWLHSHGLKRCGLSELEIFGANKETCDTYYSVIETMAIRMIENETDAVPYEPMFLAWLTERIALVATTTDWREAHRYYPFAELGKAEDRDDYHSEGTSVILIYPGPDDAEAKKPVPIQLLEEHLGTNTIFMISTAETDRMRKLAQERINYVRDAAMKKDPDIHILLKIGIKVDKEFTDPDNPNQREHIWFELKGIKNTLFNKEVFECILTQDAYYAKNMRKGSTGRYGVGDITDWYIFSGGRRYTPDDAYMM
jgi:uncharacterized protein YegJ (DUF2314 family)